jgi:hypothetical protein
MVFCDSNTETITFANYATVYTGTSPNLECLPTSGGFTSGVLANGIIDDTTMSTHIGILLTAFAANPPTGDNQSDPNEANTFATNSKKLRTALQKEYCYYYVRYVFGLTQVLTAATSSSITAAQTLESANIIVINQSPSITYGSAKTNTVLINKKLNELIQIMQKLQATRWNSLKTGSNSYYSMFNGDTADATTLNGKLKAQQDSLVAQSALLQSGLFNDGVKQAMIDYTVEKNSSSRNLLAVYGFMNIVAVGLLFYIYKASK